AERPAARALRVHAELRRAARLPRRLPVRPAGVAPLLLRRLLRRAPGAARLRAVVRLPDDEERLRLQLRLLPAPLPRRAGLVGPAARLLPGALPRRRPASAAHAGGADAGGEQYHHE